MKSQTVSVDELADHWGMTGRRVRQLADEIPIKRNGDKFDVMAADRAYIRWLQRDEPTKRSKRELLAWQRHRIAATMAREDRKVLQPDEITRLIADAWIALRQAHLSGLNALHGTLAARLPAADARSAVANLEARVNGELNLARERLEERAGRALAEMQSELRNGLLMSARQIAALEEAIGPDAAED